tara:strand:- start:8852 stop:9826 length:975 start_codon:yes stop_codon:yes gene_type:complete
MESNFRDQMIKSGDKKSAHEYLSENGGDFEVWYNEAGYYTFEKGFVVPRVPPTRHQAEEDVSPQFNWVIRRDTREPIGIHGPGYSQNTSYTFVADMMESFLPESTTGCAVLDGGRRLFMTQSIGEPVDLGDGDVIKPEIAWTASFDGTWSTGVYDFTTRVFCSNMLMMGTALFKARRTDQHDITAEYRSKILGDAMAHAETMKRIAVTLKSQSYTDKQFQILIKQLTPEPKTRFKGDFPIEPHYKSVENYNQKMYWFNNEWRRETETWDDKNKWLAYNAIQGAEQHHINLGQRGNLVAKKTRSLIKAVEGKTPLAKKTLELLNV